IGDRHSDGAQRS
ncbi:hypothetical protein A2U01_0067373, partial [Trifolium medium]|nr:hypothetical protein [Trifolium medium]